MVARTLAELADGDVLFYADAAENPLLHDAGAADYRTAMFAFGGL